MRTAVRFLFPLRAAAGRGVRTAVRFLFPLRAAAGTGVRTSGEATDHGAKALGDRGDG